jgi:prefoldin subunit 5
MTDNLTAELNAIDQRIEEKMQELKQLKRARRKLAGALEQLKLL